MKRLFSIMVLVLSTMVLLSSCGGGSGGGGAAAPLSPPAANLSGSWSVYQEVKSSTCGLGQPSTTAVTITHSGGSNSFTMSGVANGTFGTWSGTISGNSISLSGSYAQNGTETVEFSGTLNTATMIIDGTANWSQTGAPTPCSGTTHVIITCSNCTSGGGDTTPPSVPTGLTATAQSSSQIDLSWNASTDNVGVTEYKVYVYSGTGNALNSGLNTGLTAHATGLTPNTTYCFRVSALDAANNESAQCAQQCAATSSGGGGDTTPPTVPANLTASAVSSSQINLSWTASTDNVGVAGYRVERCQGSGCSNFSQIGTPTTTSYNDTGLTASTGYTYRVRAADSAGNLSSYSGTAYTTTQGATVCTAGNTRCITGYIDQVQTCNGSGTAWTQSACPNWSLCSNSACRTICDITSTPSYPTICMVPNADGVNNGEWLTWYDNTVADPTYVTGRSLTNSSGLAPVYSSGRTWPYAWSISSLDVVGFTFKLSQFGPYRNPYLYFTARRAGIITGYTNNYLVGIFNGGSKLGSCSWGPVSYSWQTTSCNAGTLDAQFNYSGGWNSMLLSITGDGFGDPIDLLDVNYLYLSIKP